MDLEGEVGGENQGVWRTEVPQWQGVWGTEVPQWGPEAKPRQEVWGWSPPEAGAFLKLQNLKFKAL